MENVQVLHASRPWRVHGTIRQVVFCILLADLNETELKDTESSIMLKATIQTRVHKVEPTKLDIVSSRSS